MASIAGRDWKLQTPKKALINQGRSGYTLPRASRQPEPGARVQAAANTGQLESGNEKTASSKRSRKNVRKRRRVAKESPGGRRSTRLAGQPAELEGLPYKQVARRKKTHPPPATATPGTANSLSNQKSSRGHPALHRVEKGRVQKSLSGFRKSQSPRPDLCENTMRECMACAGLFPIHETVSCPSRDHAFCSDCMRTLLRESMFNEARFPPRCCTSEEIPIATIKKVVTPDFMKKWNAKVTEYSLPAAQRVYCCNGRCTAFIPPEQIRGGEGHCRGCGHRTCSFCKGPVHKGGCVQDKGTAQVLELARRQRWRTCPECGTLVQLASGCMHISMFDCQTLCCVYWLTFSKAADVVRTFAMAAADHGPGAIAPGSGIGRRA
ncbi:hypothetical protein NLU13_8970 [Sarocladium strictum]|uniref:IBR domain-containing protein n=1 Tax=Sarocladium strictum TaxID=5046 RepID=A0AA39G9V3_SARSR|nr:hypothetical protein NLU13_8970 [Sarocladium strictum]